MSADPTSDTGPETEQDKPQVSITLPKPILDAVDDELTGTIGTSRSDSIKTALAIYLTENGLLDLDEVVTYE